MGITEQAALLICLDVACGLWAAIATWQRQFQQQQELVVGPALLANSTAQQPQRRRLAGQCWLHASAALVAAALVVHAAHWGLRRLLHDPARTGSGLADELSCVLCALLLVLHWACRGSWVLAAPVASGAALESGALVEAVLALRHAPSQPAGAGWLPRHYDLVSVVLAVAGTAALSAATACLLGATAARDAAVGGPDTEPLLGQEGRRGKRRGLRGGGDGRMRLIHGTLRYLVPDQLHLKLRLAACFLLLLLGRVVNIALPLAYKKVVDDLARAATAASAAARAGGGGHGVHALCGALLGGAGATFHAVFFPWVAAYLALSFLQGSSGKGGIGLLSNLRDLLWIPLQQRACRRVSLETFAHLLSLDHAFHLRRNTGKIMRILDRGTSSIQDVMQVVLFNVGPQVLDVAAACTFMALRLQPWTAVIVCVTVLCYIPMTLLITEYRGAVRRKMNKLDNEKEGKATDCLLNYETVKLFGAEAFELKGYARAIDAFQAQEYLQLACISLLNMAQSALVFVGLALGLVVCVRGIVAGQLTVGDAVLFLSLMAQLVAPLSFFGSYYRQVQKGLIDMQNMFELLEQQPSVCDAPGAGQLVLARGDVAFDNVTFRYWSGPPVLRNVSFSVPGGSTLALVGATGSGKSTCVRLLLRFYDPTSGTIRLDGTDVAAVSLASLRQHTAVVPQDTVLFNSSIRYNIRYGRSDASDQEVEEAARLAHIHDAIMHRFPEGYDTVVGERGLRLSGGEKQRVAFARAVLRRPALLVLDEATSALDSMTERMIQDSLAGLRQCCTTVIVAHRLSTIADADLIVVLEGGAVAEQGSHSQLLQRNGLYAAMWARQLEAGSLVQQVDMATPRAAEPGADSMPTSGPADSQATSRGHSVYGEDEEEQD